MSNERIAVIGDLMLDRHVQCEITGLSPEDDLTPKLKIISEHTSPGGAANVAANLRSLGCQEIHLFGVIGDDPAGKTLTRSLKTIATDGYLLKLDRPTTTKTRYVSPRGRHVVRIDREETKTLSQKIVTQLRASIRCSMPLDLIIVSDYAKGLITPYLMDLLISTNTPIIVDPKGTDFDKYGAVNIITPNEQESLLAGRHKARYLIVTRDGNGCTLYDKDEIIDLPVRRREIGDPTGCGDSFIAGLGLARARGASITDACNYALAAGACAVDHMGAYAVTAEDIKRELDSFSYTTGSGSGSTGLGSSIGP